MRVKGIVKIVITILVDFVLLYCMLGVEQAIVLMVGILLYAYIGEYIALFKDSAVGLDNLNEYDRVRLIRAKDSLVNDVREASGENITGLKLHIIPSDKINAYAYGFNNVAITRAALNVCDDMTLNAVLGHEISHILCMDAVFHRIVFANITLIIAGLILMSFVFSFAVWIVFLCLCLIGICGGLFSVFIFSKLSKMVKGFFHVLQYLVLCIYQAVMAIVSRGSEFRADSYSVTLGYGTQLSYFLSRFVEGQENRQKSLSDILYDSHPTTYKRIQRIEQQISM